MQAYQLIVRLHRTFQLAFFLVFFCIFCLIITAKLLSVFGIFLFHFFHIRLLCISVFPQLNEVIILSLTVSN